MVHVWLLVWGTVSDGALPQRTDDSRSPEQGGPHGRSRVWVLRQRGERERGMIRVWLLVPGTVGALALVRGGPGSSPVYCCMKKSRDTRDTRDTRSRNS